MLSTFCCDCAVSPAESTPKVAKSDFATVSGVEKLVILPSTSAKVSMPGT
jgi:hypothetical protein